MSDGPELQLEHLRALAERVGVTLGDDMTLLLPLLGQILGGLASVPNAALQTVEPLLTYESHRRGPA